MMKKFLAISGLLLVALGLAYFYFKPKADFKTTGFFQSGNYVYKFGPETQAPVGYLELTDETGFYSLSSEKKYIAYAKSYGEPEDNSIFIKGIETDFLMEVKSPNGIYRHAFWSPTDKYLVVNSGTGTEGFNTFFEVATGREVLSLDSGPTVFKNDAEIYRAERQEVLPSRPYASGMGYGFVYTNISTGENEVIFGADGLTEYVPLENREGCFKYLKRSVMQAADWEFFNKTKEDVYCMDLVTRESRPATFEEAAEELFALKAAIRAEIEAKYPEFKGFVNEILVSSSSKNEVVFIIKSDANLADGDIYVYTYGGVAQATKIGNGRNIFLK